MLCDNCKCERSNSDFINLKNICFDEEEDITVKKRGESRTQICYKCVYKMKLEETPKKKPPKIYKCRICSCKFTPDPDKKKRQRTIFCSEECAKTGHQKQINNHWTRKIPGENSSRKKGALKWNTNR